MTVPAWVFRHRGSLCLPPLAFSLFWFQGQLGRPLLVWPLGLGLIVLGVAVRVWAQQHLHHRLKVPLQLTVTGPYQFMRNPLYVGNTIIYVGATVLSELLWMVPITLLWCVVVFGLVVRYEESFLLSHYGQPYADYLARVPRWPSLSFSGKPPEFHNEFLQAAIGSELHNFLIVLPFAAKEAVTRFFFTS